MTNETETVMDFIGLFPTWYEAGVGSGWVVGIIATVHVLFSHTAVGAALFFSYLATVAYRNDRPELLSYIKKYGLFLLVFSYVLGSITGPGIWYSTTVASPRGISALIHNFVWGWSAEWVFFVIEVVGVYSMVYLVNKVDMRTYMRMSWIFGGASLTTMLIIVGILSFMMWPGTEGYMTEGGFLSGYYGANQFAQLAMRLAFMFTMTAVVGGIVVSGMETEALKREMARKLAILGLVSAAAGFAMINWYMSTLPDYAQLMVENRLPERFAPSMMITLGVTAGYFLITLIRPKVLIPAVAVPMVAVLLIFGLWPEETARESLRKPYVAGQYVYSNQVIAQDVPGMGIESELPMLEAHGLLATHAFLPDNLRELTPDNAYQVGEAVALAMCSNCHSLSDTGMRPIRDYYGDVTDVAAIRDYNKAALATGATIYMPAMPLKDDEWEALAVFIAALEDETVPAKYAAAKRAEGVKVAANEEEAD